MRHGGALRVCMAASCAVLLASGAAPAAAAGVSCHCFRDREYDPQNPGKTDEYLLATAANTMLAAAYGLPKRGIVSERMNGVSAEELWVSAFAAARLGADASAVRAARAASPSWRAAFQRIGGPLERLGPQFVAPLAGGAGDEALGKAAAAATCAERLRTPWPELDALAFRGATLQETVLAALLGVWSGRAPSAVFDEVRRSGAAWSVVLNRLGLVPTDLARKIPETLGATLP